MIPYGKQSLNQEDVDAVVAVLNSDFLTQGPLVPEFERLVASYCGAGYACAANSATSALHIAYLALGLGPGDILWSAPNTFVATTNAALLCGAQVSFVDICPKTYNLSLDELSAKLKLASKEGKLPKIVVAVHYAGQPCDMVGIQELAREFGFRVVEDASHALGATYRRIGDRVNESYIVGSCKHSDVTVFSFHPVKIITSGEGGMALTNDSAIAEKMRCLRSHGITTNERLCEERPSDQIWNFQQVELGFNYRMSDIHAALGISQMLKLEDFVAKRRDIAARYDQAITSKSLVKPYQSKASKSSFHLYPVTVCPKAPITQVEAHKLLWDRGIAANVHYIPVHRHPYYERLGFKQGDYPVAEGFFSSAISLPIYPGLTTDDFEKVVATLDEIAGV